MAGNVSSVAAYLYLSGGLGEINYETTDIYAGTVVMVYFEPYIYIGVSTTGVIYKVLISTGERVSTITGNIHLSHLYTDSIGNLYCFVPKLKKYSPSGDLLWEQSLAAFPSINSINVALDGSIFSIDHNSTISLTDCRFRKYDTDFNLLWEQELSFDDNIVPGYTTTIDEIQSVSLPTLGYDNYIYAFFSGILTIYYTAVPYHTHYLWNSLRKYSLDGDMIWERFVPQVYLIDGISYPNWDGDYANWGLLSVDNSGNLTNLLTVAGSDTIIKYDSSGTELWRVLTVGAGSSLSMDGDADGNIVDASVLGRVSVWDRLGNLIWSEKPRGVVAIFSEGVQQSDAQIFNM